MTERDELTPSELSNKLALYQIVTTLITFFAGFVFVTIPLVIFSVESLPSTVDLCYTGYWLRFSSSQLQWTCTIWHLG